MFHYKYLLNNYKEKSEENSDIDNDTNIVGGETNNVRYSCHPSAPFKEICMPADSGFYKSKQSCMNECENKYINTNLIISKMKAETNYFSEFIHDLYKMEKISVYLKGGTVLGLKILQLIYNLHPGKDFEKYFNIFLELNLIRDWDFVGYTNQEITPEYRLKLDELASKYKLVPRAKTFILYQKKHSLMFEENVLFEISIMYGEVYSNLELPMSTMKIWATRKNINQIFMLAKCFYSYYVNKTPIDIDIVKHIIKDLIFIIYPHKSGLFKIDNKMIDYGDLSQDLIDFIKKFSRGDNNLMQFFLSNMAELYKIYYRLIDKNIPKTDKIIKFFEDNKLNISRQQTTWLINTEYITTIVKIFTDKLSKHMQEIFNSTLKQSDYETALNSISEFLNNVKLDRVELDYDRFSSLGKKYIRILFKPLYKPEIYKIDPPTKLSKLLIFLNKQKLFD